MSILAAGVFLSIGIWADTDTERRMRRAPMPRSTYGLALLASAWCYFASGFCLAEWVLS